MSSKEITIYAPEGLVAGGNVLGESFQHFNLETGARLPLPDEQAKSDKSWHIAFKRSIICINSGPAGVGGVLGGCALPPVDVSRDDFLKLVSADFEKMFDSVSKVPDNMVFAEEGIEPAIFGWRVQKGDKWEAPVAKGWKLRLADGESFAKMRVRKVEDDEMTITIQYAYQPAKDAPLGPDVTVTIKPGDCFNFSKGEAVSKSGDNWDIKHDGDKIFLNSSVSGPGKAGAIGSNKYGAQWKTVENPSDSIAYFMDEYGTVFRNPKWYRYNIDGKHNIHPNGAVYIIRTGAGDFKIQVFDYFEHRGSDLGNIRIRYARL